MFLSSLLGFKINILVNIIEKRKPIGTVACSDASQLQAEIASSGPKSLIRNANNCVKIIELN
jgi:hypothetical protein